MLNISSTSVNDVQLCTQDLKKFLESEKFPFPKCSSGNRASEISSNLEKFPFLKCLSGNRALNLMANFREIFGNFLETVRVVIGQESVRVGMWSPFKENHPA